MENPFPHVKEHLQQHLGVILLSLTLLLYPILIKGYHLLKKKLSSQLFKHTYPILAHQNLFKQNTTIKEYIRIRHLGDTFLVIKSYNLASAILHNPDYFEISSFPSRTLNLSQNLLGISPDRKSLKNFLATLREKPVDTPSQQFLKEGNADDKIQKNSTEYEIHSNESFKQTNGFFIKEKKTYLGELYPSLATNESSDTKKTRSEEAFSFTEPVKFTSKMDRNMELLLSEHFRVKEKQTLKECYSVSTIQRPFILMKETDDKRISNIRVMNLKNGLITKKSTCENDRSDDGFISHGALPPYSPLIKCCIKEIIVLFEAKSNRKNTVNVKRYCYKHAVNILGVTVFGETISQLTNSKNEFYNICDQLHAVFMDSEKSSTIQYVNSILERVRFTKKDETIKRITRYFENIVEAGWRGEISQNCLLSNLINDVVDPKSTAINKELIESISAYLIAFSINVLEVLAGSMSLILHQLSKNIELQEKVRNNDKVEFNLEGFPKLDFEKNAKLTLTESIIEEAFQISPIDPVIQLTCKRTFHIPETKLKVNPKSVVLLPLHVLENGTSRNEKKKSPKSEPLRFLSDSETYPFNSSVEEFVKPCLKTSLAALLQQYEFKNENHSPEQDEGFTSCRFSALPDELCMSIARVEKRGEIVVFEESLKAFHALQNAPFFWNVLFDKLYSAILSH